MFLDGNQRTADYYYRPSMVAFDHPQSSVGPLAGLGIRRGSTRISRPPPRPVAVPSSVPAPRPQPVALGVAVVPNVSGKTVQDFLPRDWFDSSVYRNILDMLNTLEVARKNIYNAALGNFINVRKLPRIVRGERKEGYKCDPRAGLTGPHALGPKRDPKREAFWGWVQKFYPTGSSAISTYIHKDIFQCTTPVQEYVGSNPCVANKLKQAGYKADPPGNFGVTCPKGARNAAERHNERLRAGLGYSSADLVNLVRSLDWEMNRVHLPLPFNLRQWTTRYNQFTLDDTGIGWSQRVKGLRDLGKWIVIMREKVRKAIDASNLAKKVAEESLRNENAAIIKEREQERKAREERRRIEIQQERIAAEKLIEEERKRLVEKMKAEVAAAQKAAMEESKRIIQQAKTKPVTPVTVQPEVTSTAPVPAPVPKPTPVFVQPAVTAPVPVIAPTPVTPTPKETNWLPLIIGGVTAALFMS